MNSKRSRYFRRRRKTKKVDLGRVEIKGNQGMETLRKRKEYNRFKKRKHPKFPP